MSVTRQLGGFHNLRQSLLQKGFRTGEATHDGADWNGHMFGDLLVAKVFKIGSSEDLGG